MTVKEDPVKAKRRRALRREQLTDEWLQLGGREDDNMLPLLLLKHHRCLSTIEVIIN